MFTAVSVHLDGLNAEDKFRVWVTILGHTPLPFPFPFPLGLQKVGKFPVNFGNFPEILETYREFWKFTRNFGNLPGFLESFWKFTGNFPPLCNPLAFILLYNIIFFYK